MANKVRYGVSNLYFGEYNVATNGSVTLGTPYALPGTVNISMEPDSELQEFHADNVVYWSGYSQNGYSGTVENAMFPDDFKIRFLNHLQLANGGIAEVKGRQPVPVYMMFQGEGDAEARRGIFYNVSLGAITREYATTEETAEPQTATLPFKVSGDAKTGVVKVGVPKSASVYSTMFSTPPIPTVATT